MSEFSNILENILIINHIITLILFILMILILKFNITIRRLIKIKDSDNGNILCKKYGNIFFGNNNIMSLFSIRYCDIGKIYTFCEIIVNIK